MLLNDFLQDSAQKFSDKIAVAGPIYSPSLQEGRKAYQYLDEMSNKVANMLLDRGIEKGDRVCVFLDNSIELCISVFGILKAGGVFVVINPMTKAQKLAFMLNNCQAKFAIIDAKYEQQICEIDIKVSSIKLAIICGLNDGAFIETKPYFATSDE